MVRPMLIGWNPDKLYYYPFVISLDRCDECCNAVKDSFRRICVPTVIEEINFKVFNVIKGINKLKILWKHISFECKCKFDDRKWNSKQKGNNDLYQCECKKRISICEEDHAWNPSTSACEYDKKCEIGEYLKDYTCKRSLWWNHKPIYQRLHQSTLMTKQVNGLLLLFY